LYSIRERSVYVSLIKDNVSRREFLKRIGRYTMLATLFAGGGMLFWRKQITPEPIETCINRGICRGCSVLEDCTLPLALSMKKAAITRHTIKRS
jgi:hypothetical protein